MPIHPSPLRYPGGKTALTGRVSEILRLNRLHRPVYAEPYAGGCGLALSLLFGSEVRSIHINDVDIGVWAFWKSVLSDVDSLLELIDETPVTLEERARQKEINKKSRNVLELGFSTFFLNRVNRSGIINGGAIGGKSQAGRYKIDCRYNKESLKRRIKRVHKYRHRIHLHNLDALDFLQEMSSLDACNLFLYADPPYFNKGASLYTSFYNPTDHEKLAKAMLGLEAPWIVTYDNVPEIKHLYRSRRTFDFEINYSANIKRLGSETLIASKGLRIPKSFKNKTPTPTTQTSLFSN